MRRVPGAAAHAARLQPLAQRRGAAHAVRHQHAAVLTIASLLDVPKSHSLERTTLRARFKVNEEVR